MVRKACQTPSPIILEWYLRALDEENEMELDWRRRKYLIHRKRERRGLS